MQVGQQPQRIRSEGLLPEALVAGIADALEGKHPAVPADGASCAVNMSVRTRCVVKAFQSDGAEGVKYPEENREKTV
ncbi:hypothetical protein KCP77_23735 [Salmonella enterica subsp. enterica]|nr:hypothetical protein KCP77_23735 [Salmonella enterica subsp. enterica]